MLHLEGLVERSTFKRLTQDDKESILALNKQGYSSKDLAERFKVHLATIYRIIKENKRE